MIDAASRTLTRRRREKRSAMMKARWQDPKFRALMSAKHAAASRSSWAGPGSDGRRARLAERNRSKAMREAASRHMTELNADPAFKAELSRKMKALVARPEVAEGVKTRARILAIKVNTRRRAARDVVPPGKLGLYRKLRHAGIPRKEALRQCWMGL